MGKPIKDDFIRARVTKDEKEQLLKWASELRTNLSLLIRLRLGLK